MAAFSKGDTTILEIEQPRRRTWSISVTTVGLGRLYYEDSMYLQTGLKNARDTAPKQISIYFVHHGHRTRCMLKTTQPHETVDDTNKPLITNTLGINPSTPPSYPLAHCALRSKKVPPRDSTVVIIADEIVVNACRRQTDVIRPVVRPRGRNLITVSNSFNICVLASALSLTTACLARSSFIFAILSSLVKVFL